MPVAIVLAELLTPSSTRKLQLFSERKYSKAKIQIFLFVVLLMGSNFSVLIFVYLEHFYQRNHFHQRDHFDQRLIILIS